MQSAARLRQDVNKKRYKRDPEKWQQTEQLQNTRPPTPSLICCYRGPQSHSRISNEPSVKMKCLWSTFKSKRCGLWGKSVISSMKITEKLHRQCFWSLTVARGVVLNDQMKMLAIRWGAVHVCDRSVQLESFPLTAYFCKIVYSLSIFICYCEIICVLVKIILDLDWLMRLSIKLLIPLILKIVSSRKECSYCSFTLCWLPLFWCLLTKLY